MTIRQNVLSAFGVVVMSAGMVLAQTASSTQVQPQTTIAPSPMRVAGVLGHFAAVKGLPYSLVDTASTVTTMGDGTTTNVRVSRSMRDSDGRTRIEHGQMVDGAFVPSAFMITDPDARFQANFDAVSRTGKVSYLPVPRVKTPEEEAALAQRKAEAHKASEAREASDPDRKSLGTKMIAGVTAEGLRFSTVIQVLDQESATGRRDVRLMEERWRSPELKIDLDTTWDDPRGAKTTSVITELQRSEPDAALFKIPEGYAVTVHGKP